MIYSNNLIKTLTLLAHFFIVIGAGHVAAIVGMIEFFGLITIGRAEFNASLLSPFKNSWHSVGISSLWGQIALIASMLLKQENRKRKLILHMTGLLFLWMSIYYLSHPPDGDIVYPIPFFYIPLVIFTLLPFVFPFIRRILS